MNLVAETDIPAVRLAFDPSNAPEAQDTCRDMYMGADGDTTDPRVSPVLGSFDGLPSILIRSSADEILVADAEEIQERARQAGVEVEVQTWPGVPDVFQMFAGRLPGAGDSLTAVAPWLRRRIDEG